MSWILKNLVLMVMVTGMIFTILSVGVYLQYRKEDPSGNRPDFLTKEVPEPLAHSLSGNEKDSERELIKTAS
jgi:hypothetical protein